MMNLKTIYALASAIALSTTVSFAQKGMADTLNVLHHSITIDISDFENQQIKGSAELSIKSKVRRTNTVAFHLLGLEVDKVNVDGKALPTENISYDGDELRLLLRRSFKGSRKSHIVDIDYHGKPQGRRFGGFTWFPEQKMAHNMGVSINDVPHSYAKAWYPAIDEFTAKSTYDFTFVVPDGLTATGNGILESYKDLPGPNCEWKWSIKQPIPDYLTNVAVGPYKLLQMEYRSTDRTIPIHIYVTEDEYESAKETFSVIPATLASMESHFGSYPFDRVGFVTVNTSGGAMEHAANISMPRNPSPRYSYKEMAIHELIHSWFGDLVTCETPGDMWLNEGMTTYMVEVVLEDLLAQGLIPEDELPRYRASIDRSAMAIKKGSPRYHPLAGTPESDTYGVLVYQKGAWVMRQLRQHLGDELFFKGMREYVEKFAFDNATTEEYKESMESSTGVDLSDFFSEHIYN